MVEELRCRICPECNAVMIQTMCLSGCELVCVPCQQGVGIFNDLKEIYITEESHDWLYNKYKKDIHKMAFEKGGACCSKCGKQGGNNCDTCNIDYDYEFNLKH